MDKQESPGFVEKGRELSGMGAPCVGNFYSVERHSDCGSVFLKYMTHIAQPSRSNGEMRSYSIMI